MSPHGCIDHLRYVASRFRTIMIDRAPFSASLSITFSPSLHFRQKRLPLRLPLSSLVHFILHSVQQTLPPHSPATATSSSASPSPAASSPRLPLCRSLRPESLVKGSKVLSTACTSLWYVLFRISPLLQSGQHVDLLLRNMGKLIDHMTCDEITKS